MQGELFDIQHHLSALTQLGATWIMWLLVGLSVVCLGLVLERALYFWRSRVDAALLTRRLDDGVQRGRLVHLSEELSRARSPEARILAAGIDAARGGAGGVQERLTARTELARLDMERHLAFLGTIGNNAPFVGLLGTVIGIVGAFHELENAAGQVTAGLMSEIGEALVATAIGLLVALPAVAFFNLFQRLTRARLARAEALGQELLSHLKRGDAAAPAE